MFERNNWLGQVNLVSRPSLGQYESECGKIKQYMDDIAKKIADNNAAMQAAAAAGDQAGVNAAFEKGRSLTKQWEYERGNYRYCVRYGILWMETGYAFSGTPEPCPTIPNSPGTSPGLKGSQWFGKRFFE